MLLRKDTIQVTICGAGQLGHVFMGVFHHDPGIQVNVLSRKADVIQTALQDGDVAVKSPLESTFYGRPAIVSNSPADVIPQADVILVTVPSHARPQLLKRIAPHIRRDCPVYVGGIPGFGAFDWMAKACLQNCQNVVIWGLKDVPHTCSHLIPGKEVMLLGAKTSLYIAVHDDHQEHAETVKDLSEKLFGIKTHIVEPFLAITLTPGNPIIHPAIMYGLVGPYSQWDGTPFPQRPQFYEECNELSAYFLQRCDEEVQVIRKAVEERLKVDLYCVWPLRENLKKVYGEQIEDNRTLLTTLRTNRAYASIYAPLQSMDSTGYTLNPDHRIFTEDVPFGLELFSEIGRRFHVDTPMINEILAWAKSCMKPVDDSGINYIPAGWPEFREP